MKTEKQSLIEGSNGNTHTPPAQSGMDRKLEKKKWPPRKIAITAIATGFVLFVFFFIVLGDRSSRLNVETDKLTVSTVEKGPFQEYIPINGTIQPIQTFFLDAVEGGRVDSIFIEAGSMVKRGDRILKLGNTNLQLDVMYREALMFEQLNNARNTRISIEQNSIQTQRQMTEDSYQLELMQMQFQRDSMLFAKDLIARQEFEQTRDQYQYWKKRKQLSIENMKQDSILRTSQLGQIDASVRRMQANLDMVKQSLSNLVLRAPISGQLTSLNAEIGQSKSSGERLGQIDVLDSFKVRAAIDEFYIARIATGLNGEFDFNNATYTLVVNKVYPEVRDGRFEVDMNFVGEPPQGIRRGQTLQIRLELGDLAQATLLPRGGFYQKTGGQWVYVLDQSGDFAVKRSIKLGRQNPQVFEVLEGLEPGERVVTSSYDNFGDIDKLVLKK